MRSLRPDASRVLRLLWLIAAFQFLALASSPYRFDLWTADNGLPQNVIRGVCQTTDGYLWLATFNGLVRFDGVRFTVFDKSTSEGIKSNRFTFIFVDHNNDLWLGTEDSGITRYHRGTFTTFTSADGLANNSVRAIETDQQGHIFVLTAFSISQWQPAVSRFIKVTPQTPTVLYNPILWDQGGFWGSQGLKLYFFVDGRFVNQPLPPSLSAELVFGVARDQEGTIWLETLDGRQFKRRKDHVEWKPAHEVGRQVNLSYRDQHGSISTFVVESRLTRYTIAASVSDQTEKISFRSLFEDREGSLWLGSEGQGLYRLRRQFITVYSREQGLIDNDVYPIFQDHNGAIWIGAWQTGLSRFQGGNFTSYSTEDGLPSKLVTALAEDNIGNLWVAGHGGVRALKGRHFRSPPGLTIPDHAVTQAIHQDRSGTFWLGTSAGLIRYREGVSTRLTAKDGLAGDDVRVIVESVQGDLWIGGYGGLTRLSNGQFTSWTKRDGLPDNTVRSIYIDHDDVVWIGTYDGGLGRLQNGRLTRYTVREGLFNNGVFQTLEDAHGNFWISCNRGIYRVSKRELNEFAAGRRTAVVSIRYGRIDGMLNVECNGGLWPAGIKARDGTLWFPTENGVAVINPETVPTNPRPPPVVIESALLDGTDLPTDRPLTMPPRKENLEIHYTALSFVSSQQIRFKYKLDPLDSTWVEAGPRRTAYYSHIPPGRYTFSVIASNSDGVWNNEGQSLQVSVIAPFNRTYWFDLLVICSLAIVVWAIWRYRVVRFEQEHALQQAFSRELIASQENERKRIAAELHDSLGQRLVVLKNIALFSLRSPASDVNGEAAHSMREISEEANMAIEETRQISYNLRPFQLDRLGLTKAIEGMVRRVSSASGLPIVSDLDNIDELFPEDLRINFYRIIQESLNNIMKYACGSQASVRVRKSGDHVLLTISDDGCGFATGTRHHDSGRSGFGLTGMAERARLLGGELKIHSVPGQGTTITVEIPRRQPTK